MQELLLRTAATLAIAVGHAVSAGPAQADLVWNVAYAFSSVSFDPEVADSLGIAIFPTTYTDWYANEDSAHSGDATYYTVSGSYPAGQTAAQSYTSASGTANAGSGANSSWESSSASAASYLYVNTTTSFNVLLPIRNYLHVYASAYSDGHYSGFAFGYAQVFVEVYNSSKPYIAHSWSAQAFSAGAYGIAGPFIAEEELFYTVLLTPGGISIVGKVSVDTYGFVSVPSPVPEPGTLTLAAVGLVSIGCHGVIEPSEAS